MLCELRRGLEEEVRRDGQAAGTAAGMRPGTNPLTPPNTLTQPPNPHTHPLEPSNPPDVLGLSPRSQPRSGGSGVPSSESCNKAKAKAKAKAVFTGAKREFTTGGAEVP